MKLPHSKIGAIPSHLEGEGHDCMARIVPDNPFFPPSVEVRAGGTSPWTGEGRTMQEQIVESNAQLQGWSW
jgi:hypothetical protein